MIDQSVDLTTEPTTAEPTTAEPTGTGLAAAAAPGDRRLPSWQGGARGGGRRRLWLAGLVIVGALAFLVLKGLGSSLVYFKTADQAVAARGQLGTSAFQIEGVVVPGSVHPTTVGVDFVIANGGVTVPVTNQGSPPQLFQPNVPVVLVGHFEGPGNHYLSDQIMVKHSANYVARHPGRVTAPDGSLR